MLTAPTRTCEMSSAEDFDLGAEKSAPDGLLKSLHDSATEARELKTFIADLENQLSSAKERLQELTTKRMPELMAQLSMPDFTFGGWNYEVSDFVSGSLPKDPERRKKATSLLRDYGAEGLFKTEITAQFGRSQSNMAIDLFERLKAEGHSVSMEEAVHAQTLQAFGRQRLREGQPIDAEVLGLFVGKVVKFSETGKKGKGRKDEIPF